ncbi:MAG: oligosaccharide flippase family protein [Cytobacillus gottheilii]|uniref:oligosaccharide flippase family protein n=1 Tax=Cytobacillus gottheilii TaxID=859144 RepID=UPI003464D284
MKNNLLKKNLLKKNKLIYNIFTLSSFDIGSKIFNTLLTIILIRILSSEDYGNYTIFLSIGSYISGIIASGLNLSYVRYESENISRGNKVTTNLFLLNIFLVIIFNSIISITLFLNIDFIMSILGVNQKYVLVSGVFYGIFISCAVIVEGFFHSREKYKLSGIILNLRAIALLISVLLLLAFQIVSVKNIIIFYLLVSALNIVILFIFIFKKFKFKIGGLSKPFLREYFGSSVYLLGYSLFLNLFNQIDIFMVSGLRGTSEAGQYGVAYRYYAIFLSLLPAIKSVLRVHSSKAEMIDSLENQKNLAYWWLKKFTIPIIILIVLTLVFVEPIFILFNGIEYAASVPVFQVLLIGVVLSYLFAPYISILMSMKKYKAMLFIALISCIVHLILCYYLTIKVGIVGAAVATVVAHGINNGLAALIVIKNTKEKLL